MSFFTDPLFLTVLVAGGIFVVSYALGKAAGEGARDETIEKTILYLINERYVKAKRDNHGEWELLRFDEEL
jgi:hypothetical protein